MKHVSLYRKWRPQVFKDVIGQDHVTKTLTSALSSKRVVHAYLFCGPRGTGKTSTARILAKAVNCAEGPTPEPCNECEACLSISEGTALDVVEIDAASNRKIDEIRELLEKIPYAPISLSSKVYIVDEVHQLTPEAASALLKTLEEPPEHVVFVLATTEPNKLLPTIVSRCQRFDFALVGTESISRLLEKVAREEEIDIEPEALEMIAEHARGSVRDAIGVIDQLSSMSGERVTLQHVAELLGEVESAVVLRMVDLVAERDPAGILQLVGEVVEGGKDPRRFLEAMLSHLRSLFLIQNSARPREVVTATDDHYGMMKEQAARMRSNEVVRLIERLGETHREMRWSENPRLVLEYSLVKAAKLEADVSVDGLLFRLEELEALVRDLRGGGAPAAAPEKAGKAEGEPPRAPGEKEARPEPAPKSEAGEAEPEEAMEEEEVEAPAGTDREKAKRAWAAVLTELKRSGDMRTYALLMKARVMGVEKGELVISFPSDASFQLDVLKESVEMEKIDDICSRFMGCECRVRLEGQERKKRRAPGGSEAGKKAAPGGAAEAPGKKPERKSAGGKDAGEEKKKTGNDADLAKLLMESFDGEIVEEDSRGKE